MILTGVTFSNGTYGSRVVATVTWTATYASHPVLVDHFERTGSTGWGIADSGQLWENRSYYPNVTGVDGTAGWNRVGNRNVADEWVNVDFPGSFELNVTARLGTVPGQDGSLGILVYLGIGPRQVFPVMVGDHVEMPGGNLGGVEVNPYQAWHLKVAEDQSTDARIKFWPDSQPEPPDWMTCTGCPDPGQRQGGFAIATYSGTAEGTLYVDDITITDTTTAP